MRRAALILFVASLIGTPQASWAQSNEGGLVDRLSVSVFHGWPKELTTAFAGPGGCNSDQAREVGLGVSMKLGALFAVEVVGSRHFARDPQSCTVDDFGEIPPDEGPFSYLRRYPTDSTTGYPFSTLWSRLNLQHQVAEGVFGRVFGGFGYMAGKGIPVLVSGFAGEFGTDRFRVYFEYEVAWYDVPFDETKYHFVDAVLIHTENLIYSDAHRSAVIRLGTRVSLHGWFGDEQ